MIIKRTALLDAMNSTKPGLASSAKTDQMKNIQFTGNDIITFNDALSVLYPFETDFEASVNFNDLEKIISKLSSDEIEMKVVENELLISSKGTKAGLVLSSADELNDKIDTMINQMPSEENDLKWIAIPNDFLNGISLCSVASSDSLDQGILACVYTNGSHIISSDNKRVAIFELKEKMDVSFFIRAGIISELLKFKFVEFCVSKTWVYFTTEDNLILSVRRVYGEKIDYFSTLLNDFKGKGISLPDDLKDIVNSAAVMATNDNDKEMSIGIKDGKITCFTQNERGWVEKWTDTNVSESENVELNISALHLAQVLDMPELKMQVGDTKSLFESGQFKYILIHRG